ncbi:hypothetical protein Tco_0699713 [Tanacetum coccineum]|uniref:Reverse transcriptase domain-containing protein n=1 Tax=Tanacetum coccineum TaxID=301880 RepID=A0ABQ5F085_9ASTR
MANTTPIVTIVTKTANKEKTQKETDKVNIHDFYEEHYDDILPIIMDKVRRDKQKEVHARLDFGESSKKGRRAREGSQNSSVGISPARYHSPLGRPKMHDRLRYERNMFNHLSHRRKSVHERLSDTYSLSITRSGPSRTSSRDPSHTRGRSPSRDRTRYKNRLHGVEESYDGTYSPQGTKTQYGGRSHDKGRSRSLKRWRKSKSPPSSESKSCTSNTGHRKPRTKRGRTSDEKDRVVPWSCEDVDPFTLGIRNFKSLRKTRMTNNVKTYDGTGDPEDHLKIFQAATQKDLEAAFLAYFMQQKKCVKDPVEIHNIKQRDGETIEEFMERFKFESGRMKGPPKCMRIFGFMHGVNNPELTKRLNEHVPKTVDEMMITTTEFIRTPKEIFATDKRSSSKFCEFHNDKGHITDECMLLKKPIEELVKAGKLSHFIKEMRQDKDKQNGRKKEASAKKKPRPSI